jgi:hypothetical protein
LSTEAATSTLIQLAFEHEVTVTPMDNGLKELPDESDSKPAIASSVPGCSFGKNPKRYEGMHTNYDYEEFGQALEGRIRALREAKGLESGANDDRFWQSIEAGRKMSLQTMLRVANTFDLTVEELLQDIKRRKGSRFGSYGFYREHPQKRSKIR